MRKQTTAGLIEDERERVIEEFVPIIKHLAYKVSRGFEDNTIVEDLISAGIIGLLEAIEKFDPERGVKLNTFSYLRIRGAMIDELRNRDWFPRSARTKSKRISEVIRKLENKFGRYPEDYEIAKEMNIDYEEYLSMVKDYGNLSVLSIEDIYETTGEDRERIIQYVTDESSNPEEFAAFREVEKMLAREIDRLPERQKLVLSLYYHEDLNMKEIAAILEVTEARICQIHSQAILNLRSTVKKHT